MFSKSLNLFLSAFLGMALAGCGLKVGESPAPEGEVRIEGYSCVNQISEKVGDYFRNELDETEVVQFVDCLKKSISDFSKRVGTRGQTTFSPEDLRSFINHITKPGRELNPELLKQFMRVKQTFVGGGVDRITRSDLTSALNLLEEIKKAALILLPHVHMFNSDLGSKVPPNQIAVDLDKASVALDEVAKIFVASLKSTENPYSLSDFEEFLEEFRKFINWYEVYPDAIATGNWVALLKSAQEIATGLDNSVIRQSDWDPYLSLLKSSYILYLKTKYGVLNQSLLSGVGLKNFVHVVSQALRDLSGIVSRRGDRKVSAQEIERWISAMGGMNWIPFGLNPKTAFSGLKLMSTKIFSVTDEFTGIDVLQLSQVSRDFEEWASVQLYISERFAPNSADVAAVPPIIISGLDSQQNSSSKTLKPPGWAKLEKLIKSRRPLHRSGDSKVFLAHKSALSSQGVKFDLYNVSMTHLYSSILGLIYRSYGQMEEGEVRLSSESLQSFYEEFYELGVGLKWLDPRSKTAGARSYIEGNLFTYSSNGFSKEYDLNLSEGIDLVAYLLSGGELTDEIYYSLKDTYNCEKGELDIRGDEKLKRTCVESHLIDALLERLSFAPGLSEWLKTQSRQDRESYAQLLLNAGFSQATSSLGWVEKSELSTMSVVMLYSESLLTRFDTDNDGILSDLEVKPAFLLFKEFIGGLVLQNTKKYMELDKGRPLTAKELSEIEPTNEKTLRTIFEFILHYRRMPQTSKPSDWLWTGDELDIRWNMGDNPGWDINMNRRHMAEAFSVIINQLLNPPKVEPKNSENPVKK